MKKNLFLILLILFSLKGTAQQTSAMPANEPKIFNQPDLGKFYGTWLYEKNGQYFCITLKKDIFISPENSRLELLIGTHILKQNGKILDEKGKADILNSINSGTIIRPNKNLISFRFKEYRRGVFGTGTMEYVEGLTPTLIWKLNLPESRSMVTFPGEENKKDPEYLVPTSITMCKVKK